MEIYSMCDTADDYQWYDKWTFIYTTKILMRTTINGGNYGRAFMVVQGPVPYLPLLLDMISYSHVVLHVDPLHFISLDPSSKNER